MNDLLMRIQATVSGVSVRRPSQLATTAVGAMRMARVGAGAADSNVAGTVDSFEPEAGVVDVEQLWRRWQSAVERSRGWART